MNPPAVLVTDGNLRSSLAVARSLGRAGYRVYVCSPLSRSLAGQSRHTFAQRVVPDPLTQPAAFADAVIALTKELKIEVLLPMSEEALLAVLPETARLPEGMIPFPSLEIFRKVSNKNEVTELAATLGISIPEQVVLTDNSASQIAAVDGLSFPLVLKPARSVAGEGAARTKMSVMYVDTRADFDRQIATMQPTAFPLLVQRRIKGPGIGVFLLRWHGQIIAQFAHRRIREKPPSGGVSVCAESIKADPAAVERSAALLAALDWSGPAMVEYKQDEATGRLYLMEINGRFWGSLQLAVDAGVDFPALLVAAARGENPTPVTEYKVGVQTHWWWGEVDHLIARVKRPHEAPALGGRARAVWRFLMPGRGLNNEVLRLNDIRPSIYETLNWFRGR